MFEKFGPPNVKWCERTLCTWMNEPANAVSNIGYIVVAILIFLEARRNKNGLGVGFAWIVFVVGATSWFYHATNNYFTQVLDFVGMFFYVFLLLVFNLRRLGAVAEKNQWWFYGAFVAAATAAVPILARAGIPYQILIALSAVGIVVTEGIIFLRKGEPETRYAMFGVAIVFFAAAAACSASDVERLVCDPDNHFLQGHALWHLLSSVGIYFSYRFFARLRIMNPGSG